MQFIGAAFCNATMACAFACIDIGLRLEEFCVSDDRRFCRAFEILLRIDSIEVREWIGRILVRDCFEVTARLPSAVSARELSVCDILVGPAPDECAEFRLLVNGAGRAVFGDKAKR